MHLKCMHLYRNTKCVSRERLNCTCIHLYCLCAYALEFSFLISMVLFLAALVTKASISCLKSTLPLTFRSDTARLFTIFILDNNFCFQVKADEMLQWVKVLAGKPDDLSFDLWNSHCGRKELNPSICPLTSTKAQ